jgi:hypothetical protein
MNWRTFTTRFISVFVIAFICLNGVGALCVAYCQTFDMERAAALEEHCPMSKEAGHHSKSSSEDKVPAFNVGSDELDCCPLTVTFVSAPLEAKNQLKGAALPKQINTHTGSVWTEVHRLLSAETISYRGPPLDRRVDRIKHCVLLI